MPNRLIDETSPYLLQHAHNPVDWYPWGEEALARAKAEDKPILLSIGYSACHWCHVMERESFEDEATAQAMNATFVNIKVDREERPDLDEIYMSAVQAFTGGHGGWPMTVFLTPEGKPFFGGTYFPPEPRQGMPSFRQVMEHVFKLWSYERAQVTELTRKLDQRLASLSRLPAPEGELRKNWLTSLCDEVAGDFDAENGGLGTAPKFPPHATLMALLVHHALAGDADALDMATATLDGMAKGGMYDLLGGGFARYSVDAEWRVPHFEKMLYDNGQLVPVYLAAHQLTGSAHYARIARETLDWALREMQLEHGAFAASQDADTEGVEGKFFSWTPEELRQVVGVLDGITLCGLLQVTDAGTFEHGMSVLRLEEPYEALPAEQQALLDRCLPKLLAHRATRTPPGRDDKVITAWNGLMISALARGAWVLDEPRYAEAAARAFAHIQRAMVVDGRLMRTFKDGRAHVPAFLDDHSFLLAGLLDLYEATFEPRWLQAALYLADDTVTWFWDEATQGFFYTGHDAEPLVTRSRKIFGGAEPSGSSVAALCFARLAALAGREDLGAIADAVLRSMQPLVDRAPRILAVEAQAVPLRTGSGLEVGLTGDRDSDAFAALAAPLRRTFLPQAVRAAVHTPEEAALAHFMAERPLDGPPTAYVCQGFSCKLPVQDAAELQAQLDEVRTLAPKQPAAKPSPFSRPAPEPDAAPVRAPALPTGAENWLNGAPLSLEELRGQVVVLDFWTYCCINCLHVLPVLADIEARFAREPVVVIGVHAAKFPTEQERESVALAIDRHDVRHPVVLDPEHQLWSQYAIRSWPTLVLIDATGRIAFTRPGEANADDLAAAIQLLLDRGRDDGSLTAPVWQRPEPKPRDTLLSFPGKLSSHPDAAAQLRGEPAWGEHTRVYVSDTGHHRILECTVTRDEQGWPVLHTERVFGGEPGFSDGADARFFEPQGTARDGRTLYVADTGNHAVRAIDLDTGAVTTVAGTGQRGEGLGEGDFSDPTTIPLRSPWDVAAQDGVVFIAMAGTHQLWILLTHQGQVAPFIGSGGEGHVDGSAQEAALAQPSGLTLLGRHLFWVDSETSSLRVYDLAERTVGTLAGKGLFDFGDVDGPATQALLQHPLGITVAAGAIYVADTFNHKLKRLGLEANRQLQSVTGPVLREPGGLCTLGEFVLIADTGNHRLMALHTGTGELREVG